MDTQPVEKDGFSLLYREVNKIPLSTILPNNKPPRSKTHAIIDKQSGDILHFCSKEYKLKSNHIIFSPFEKLLSDKRFSYTINIREIDNTKFYVDYILKTPVLHSGVGQFLPRFSVWNSYDGTVKAQIKFGFLRLLSNGCMARPGDCDNICSGMNYEDNCMDEFWERFSVFIRSAKDDLNIFERLDVIKTGPDIIEKIGLKLKLSPKIREEAVNKFEKYIRGNFTYKNAAGDSEYHDGSKLSCFTAYSAMNYAIYNFNNKELPDYKVKRDRAILKEFLKYL